MIDSFTGHFSLIPGNQAPKEQTPCLAPAFANYATGLDNISFVFSDIKYGSWPFSLVLN
jgi:hypothetical protein